MRIIDLYSNWLAQELSYDDTAYTELVKGLIAHGVTQVDENIFIVPDSFTLRDELFAPRMGGNYKLKGTYFYFKKVFENNDVIFDSTTLVPTACFRVGGAREDIKQSLKELDFLGLDMELKGTELQPYIQVHPRDVRHTGYDTTLANSSLCVVWSLADAANGDISGLTSAVLRCISAIGEETGEMLSASSFYNTFIQVSTEDCRDVERVIKFLNDTYPDLQVEESKVDNCIYLSIPEIEPAIVTNHGVYTDGKVLRGRRVKAAEEEIKNFYANYGIIRDYEVIHTEVNDKDLLVDYQFDVLQTGLMKLHFNSLYK